MELLPAANQATVGRSASAERFEAEAAAAVAALEAAQVPLQRLECQVSKLVNSDACPRPTPQAEQPVESNSPRSRHKRLQQQLAEFSEDEVGLGRIVALYHCSFASYRIASIFGASISEATMRSHPRTRRRVSSASAGDTSPTTICRCACRISETVLRIYQ